MPVFSSISSVTKIILSDTPRLKVADPYPIGQRAPQVEPVAIKVEISNEEELPPEDLPPEPTTVNLDLQAPPLAKISILNPNRNLFWPDFEIDDKRTAQAFGYFIVPITTLGSWDHPWYGDVSFTEQDFAQMKSNFENRAAGYEPALYVGHAGMLDAGGRAAAGFLEVLTQVDDVLWGIFAAVDEQVYLDVKKGKYRYSSAEMQPDAVHRQSGEELGLVLTGCALTNEPFITNLPPVRAYSTGNSQSCTRPVLYVAHAIDHNSFLYDNSSIVSSDNQFPLAIEPNLKSTNSYSDSENCMTTSVSATSSTAATPVEAESTFSAPIASVPVPVAAALEINPTPALAKSYDLTTATALTAQAAELSSLKAQFSSMQETIKNLQVQNAQLVQARVADTLAQNLSIVNNSTLSAASKMAFSSALKTPNLPAQTSADLIAQVMELSSVETNTFLTQHGATGTTELTAEAALASAAAATAEVPTVNAYSNFLQKRAAIYNIPK